MFFKSSTRVVLLLVIVLLYVPFLNQAFHIDDRIYLEIADNIHLQPFFPYDYKPVFEGVGAADAASHSHLPLTSYYLSFVQLVSGTDAEWVYHTAFLVFPILAAFAFFDLAQRYVRNSLPAAILLVGAPAFSTLGHTLMPDVPLLTFWLLSLSRLLRITSGKGSKLDHIVLPLSVLAAAFISMVTFGLVLLIVAFLLLDRKGAKEASTRYWVLVLLSPLILWVAWYLRAYLHYDRFVLVNTLLHMDKRQALDWTLMGAKVMSFVLNVGGVFLFPLLIWVGVSGRWRTRFALLAFFLAFVPFYFFGLEWAWVHILLFALMLASGILLFWEFLALLGDNSAETRLVVLWFFGILTSCLVLYYAGSVRYTLLALPPAILVLLRCLEHRIQSEYFLRNIVWSGVLLSLFYSVPIAYADYRFAGLYRTAAEQLCSKYGTSENQVWFTGEWGFRYYFEKEGAKMLPRTSNQADVGDIIIKPYIASPWVTLYDGDVYTDLLEQRIADIAFPVRILDFSSHAGFYSTGWGFLPYSYSLGENWEWFNVFRIKKQYSGPLPEAEQHW